MLRRAAYAAGLAALVGTLLTGCGGPGRLTGLTPVPRAHRPVPHVAVGSTHPIAMTRQWRGTPHGSVLRLGSDCSLTGTPTAHGRIINRGRHARDYLITVDWLNDHARATTRAQAEVRRLPPGASRAWSAVGVPTAGLVTCRAIVLDGRLR